MMVAVTLAVSGCKSSPNQAELSTTDLVELWARAAAPDGSPHCADGAVVRIEGQRGFKPLTRAMWQPGTIFDLRGASWTSRLLPPPDSRNCYPLQFGADWGGCKPDRVDLYSGWTPIPQIGPPLCVLGGTVVGTQPDTASWGDVKRSAGMAVVVNARRPTVEGMRIHNHEDAFVPLLSQDFMIRGNWVSYIRDDCIENDAFATGLVHDNLFDGCYVFYSAVNGVADPPIAVDGGSGASVTLRGNLVRLQNMPGPYKGPPDAQGYGRFFKMYDKHAPKIVLEGNIFLVEAPINDGNLDLADKRIDLSRCADNVIVWAGEDEYPGDYHPSCFTVTNDRAVWDQARRRWITRHRDVVRLPDKVP